MKSNRFELISKDLQKILVGALIAGVGAAGTALFDALPNVDFGEWTPFVAAILAVVANLFRKWISTTKYSK